MHKIIAVFDFDGTITKKDTLWLYLVKTFGMKCFVCLMVKVSLYLIGSVLGVCSRSMAKEKLIQVFLSGMKLADYQSSCITFANNNIDIVRKDALEEIRRHIKNQNDIYIVTASPTVLVREFARRIGVKESNVIGTELEVTSSMCLTGKFATPNCVGKEKVRRLLEKKPNIKDQAVIYGYGDSRGDDELLLFCDVAFYRKFNK